MSELPKKRLTKADIVLIAALVCLTVFLFVRPLLSNDNAGSYFTVITPDGSRTYSLSDSTAFEVKSRGITLTVHVSGGQVSVTGSDCPDKVCISTGKISRVGQSIVCIPAEVVIKIGEGGGVNEDFIVG